MDLNYNELLKKYINQNERILKEVVANLTEPGENYCSDMHKVELLIENVETNSIRPLYIVVKSKQQKVVSGFGDFAKYQFDKEISFYEDIVPTLEEFHMENQVVRYYCFPSIFAASRNIHVVNEKDEGYLIIMENLKMQDI